MSLQIGDLVIYNYRWSILSFRIGILLQKLHEQQWVILWKNFLDESISIETMHQSNILKLDDNNFHLVGKSWTISNI